MTQYNFTTIRCAHVLRIAFFLLLYGTNSVLWAQKTQKKGAASRRAYTQKVKVKIDTLSIEQAKAINKDTALSSVKDTLSAAVNPAKAFVVKKGQRPTKLKDSTTIDPAKAFVVKKGQRPTKLKDSTTIDPAKALVVKKKERPSKQAKAQIDTLSIEQAKALSIKEKPRPIKLKVLTFNISHGVTPKGTTNLVQLAEIIKKNQPDLVALQELDSGATRSGKLNQIKILALLTGYDTFFTKTLTLEEGIHGIGILTRHNYEVIHNRMLPSPEASEDRYVQSVLVEMAEGRHIHFVNTALDDASPLNRGLQAAFLNQMLTNSIYPVIVAGTFGATVGIKTDATLESLTKHWTNYPQDEINEVEVAPKDRREGYFWLPQKSLWELVQYEVLDEIGSLKHQPVLATFVWHN